MPTATMHPPSERPATRIPPPLVYAAALGGGWWLDPNAPLPLDPGHLARPIGWALVALGVAGVLWAALTMWRHRTTVNPFARASHLAIDGPFAWSRNPIYCCDWLIYAGVTLLLGTWWPVIVAPLVWAVMRFLVIRHEEAHLVATFGDEYRRYSARVRRWV